MVLEKVVAILQKYCVINDSRIKRFTVFALLSYGDDDHNIKVEINVRTLVLNIKESYEIRKYLGISMFVAKKDYLFGGKLAALTLRSETAMRDVYDIHYFAKNHWDINTEVIRKLTGKSVKEYLADCIAFVEKVKDNRLLHGLGELLLGEKEKAWIRSNLKSDTVFLLKNYMSVLK